jgi:hypothetical protein
LGQQHERPAVVETGDVVDQGQLPKLLVEPVALPGILDPVDEVPKRLEGRTETLLCVAKPGIFAVSHKPEYYQTTESAIECVVLPTGCGTLEGCLM